MQYTKKKKTKINVASVILYCNKCKCLISEKAFTCINNTLVTSGMIWIRLLKISRRTWFQNWDKMVLSWVKVSTTVICGNRFVCIALNVLLALWCLKLLSIKLKVWTVLFTFFCDLFSFLWFFFNLLVCFFYPNKTVTKAKA